MFGPVEVLVICNDDKPFAFVSSGFDTTLDKEVYTVAVVARSPRRIGVEAIEDPEAYAKPRLLPPRDLF